MRKFRVKYKDYLEVANNQVAKSINILELTVTDLRVELDYLFFFGDCILTDVGNSPNMHSNRILLIIPRENLISLEEIF